MLVGSRSRWLGGDEVPADADVREGGEHRHVGVRRGDDRKRAGRQAARRRHDVAVASRRSLPGGRRLRPTRAAARGASNRRSPPGSSSAARSCSRWSSSAASRASRTRGCRSPSGSRSSARCRRLMRRRLAGGVREVPGDARVPRRQPRDDARRVQGHLLVGILPSAAGPRDRRRVPRAAPVVPRAPAHSARARVAARGHFRARRAAGRASAGTWCKAASSTIRGVSQFRLTAHLGLAFAIFAAMLWTALSLASPARVDQRGASARVDAPLRLRDRGARSS